MEWENCGTCGGAGDLHGDAHVGYGMTERASESCGDCRGLGLVPAKATIPCGPPEGCEVAS